MTDQELKDLVASLAIESAKNEAKWDKLNEERAIESAKTENMIKELSIQMSGMSKTQGEITEDYFYNILKENKEVAGIKFDNIERNLYQFITPVEKGEYDIILFNG